MTEPRSTGCELPRDAAAGGLTEAASLANRCVHCGFCNAVCPTYGLTGDEREGPRGRIWQIRLLASDQARPADVALPLDHCLGCRACESVCPSGVPYHRIAGLGRRAVTAAGGRAWHTRLLRAALLQLLLNRWLFSRLVALHRWLRPWLPAALARLVPRLRSGPAAPGVAWPPRPAGQPAGMAVLDNPLGQRRAEPCVDGAQSSGEAGLGDPLGPRTDPIAPLSVGSPCIALLAGCVQPVLLPSIDAQFTALVVGAGGRVFPVAGAGCCGALAEHLDAHARARWLVERQIEALERAFAAGARHFTLTASGCAAFVHDWPALVADAPPWHARASAVVARFLDPVAVVCALPRGRVRPREAARRVALQAPCSVQHGGVGAAPLEAMLRSLGLRLTTGGEGPCCGSAGAYSLLYPGTAEHLREARLDALLASGADCIASANVGCITHLQAGTELQVLHWLELLESAPQAQGR